MSNVYFTVSSTLDEVFANKGKFHGLTKPNFERCATGLDKYCSTAQQKISHTWRWDSNGLSTNFTFDGRRLYEKVIWQR